jgi:hypothetical protein
MCKTDLPMNERKLMMKRSMCVPSPFLVKPAVDPTDERRSRVASPSDFLLVDPGVGWPNDRNANRHIRGRYNRF